MNEKEYELREVRLGRFTKRIKVRLLETTYEYKKDELCVVRKMVVRVLKTSAEVLDGLPDHMDEAVRRFCEQIAECVGEARYPVWYRRLLAEREMDAEREKLRARRTALNEKYDRESRPYREEAKAISRRLMFAYAAAEEAEEKLAQARAACVSFRKKRSRPISRLMWRRYSDNRSRMLASAVRAAAGERTGTAELIGALEQALCASTRNIAECEGRRAGAMRECHAREEALERSWIDKLGMLK